MENTYLNQNNEQNSAELPGNSEINLPDGCEQGKTNAVEVDSSSIQHLDVKDNDENKSLINDGQKDTEKMDTNETNTMQSNSIAQIDTNENDCQTRIGEETEKNVIKVMEISKEHNDMEIAKKETQINQVEEKLSNLKGDKKSTTEQDTQEYTHSIKDTEEPNKEKVIPKADEIADKNKGRKVDLPSVVDTVEITPVFVDKKSTEKVDPSSVVDSVKITPVFADKKRAEKVNPSSVVDSVKITPVIVDKKKAEKVDPTSIVDTVKITPPVADKKRGEKLDHLSLKSIVKTSSVVKGTPTRESKRKRKSFINPEPEEPEKPKEPEVPAVPVEPQQNGNNGTAKRRRLDKNDSYCWRCHKEAVDANCAHCPRAYHRRCMGGAPPLSCTNWVCPECISVQQSTNPATRLPSMSHISIDQLIMMLKYVIERMREQTGSGPFWKAVDVDEIPNYLEYIIKPMDLSLLEKNLCAKLYSSTEEFMADARWIQHNCTVYNTLSSKLTNTAKQMLKVARQEISELEACPDCFLLGRNLPDPVPTWFIEPCHRPHPIVWAKLKGFPFWPAKALPRLNTQGLIDVRFFGEHDRAWVSPKDVYLYSPEPPAVLGKKKKIEMELVVKEVEDHIKKLELVFGDFKYASTKIIFDPHDKMQIKKQLPNYDPIENKRIDSPKDFLKNDVKAGAKAGNIKIDKNMTLKVVTPKLMSPTVVTPKLAVNKSMKLQQSPSVESKTKINKRSLSVTENEQTPDSTTKSRKSKGVVNEVPTTNGTVEAPSGRRSRVIRKKKFFDPLAQETPTKKKTLENNKSLTPPTATSPIIENKSPETATLPLPANNLVTSNNDSKKLPTLVVSSTVEPNTLNSEAPKRTIAAVRRGIGGSIKKIKLKGGINNEVFEKMVIQKNAGPLNTLTTSSLQDKLDSMKTVTLTASGDGRIPKTIFLKSSNLVGITSPKIVVKTPQSVNKKLGGKEAAKVVLNNAQRIAVLEKDPLSLNNKSMTSTPTTVKDCGKSLYLVKTSKEENSLKNVKDLNITASSPNVKPEPKDDEQLKDSPQKPGKARKSFPTKITHPQVVPGSVTSVVFSPTPMSSPRVLNSTVDGSHSINIHRLPPAEAGPTTLRILKHSKELAAHFTHLIIDTIKDSSEKGDGIVDKAEATLTLLKLKMERIKWDHQQEINELKRTNEVAMRELKNSMEVERFRALKDAQREAEINRLRCIEETKRKQWCVVCGGEAMFYCCWNTAYCDYPCQKKHWNTHSDTCGQKTQMSQLPQKRLPSTSLSSNQSMPKLVISKPSTHSKRN